MAKRKEKSPPQKVSEEGGQGAGGGGRSRTRERRLERERQKRRQQQLTLAGVIVAAVVIVMVLLVIANQPADAPIPENAVTRYADIPQGKTGKGYPQLGEPGAPVQLVEYSSFACSACARFHEEVFPALLERVKGGEISFTYVPLFSTGSIQNGEGAARAAVCASEQGQFWPVHDALFTWQVTFGNQAFTQNRLLSGLANLGIDRTKYDQCINSDLPGEVVNAAEADRVTQGVTSTPAILVNGIAVGQLNQSPTLEEINAAIDNALAQLGVVPEATPEVTQEATAEASVEPTGEATPEATTSIGS